MCAALVCASASKRGKLLCFGPKVHDFKKTSMQVRIMPLSGNYSAVAPWSPSNLPLWEYDVVGGGLDRKGDGEALLGLLRLL